jgi:hypothetical protein
MVAFPAEITAGETLKARMSVSGASSVVAHIVGPSKQSMTYTEDGTKWTGEADTADWSPGAYRFEVWVSFDDGTRRIEERGTLTVAASLETEEGGTEFDARSRAQRMVEKIEAMLEGNASKGVRRYKINNRELERYSVGELMEMLAYWKRQAAIEARRAKGVSVLGPRIEFRI